MKRVFEGLFFLFLLFFFIWSASAHEDPTLEADLMILDEKTSIITCEGNVLLSVEDLQVSGTYATINVEDLSFFFSGDVSMELDDFVLKAHTVEGDLESENLLAREGVVITYPQYSLKGDLFQHKAKEEMYSIQGDVEFTSEEGDLSGDRMEWDGDLTYFQVIGSASWRTSEASGEAQRIIFKEEEGTISFYGEVLMELRDQKFYGEEIIYSFKGGRVQIKKGGIQLPSLERD